MSADTDCDIDCDMKLLIGMLTTVMQYPVHCITY